MMANLVKYEKLDFQLDFDCSVLHIAQKYA